jgi:Leucine-rich repeat (LRR) protein
MHARSYKYPDSEDNYVDTTYYDETFKYLDLGYQRLKQLDIKLYPEFSYLKKLFVYHNNLKLLPDPKHLPMIEELTCDSNYLTTIPFYPKLTFLNISNNKILSCAQYHNSNVHIIPVSSIIFASQIAYSCI